MPIAAPMRPFLDWQVEVDPEAWSMVDISLIGIPFSAHYPGDARPNPQTLAPEAIRLQSAKLTDGPDYYDFNFGATLREVLPRGGRDSGNILPASGDFDAYFAEAVSVMKRQFATAKFVAMLGGDHGATIPALHGLEALGQKVHIVQIDAHIDWREELGGARLGYSSTIRRASELPWVSGITQIGLRGVGSARAPEVQAARDWGAKLITAAQIHQEGLGATLAHLRGKGPFYLTIDADGLDPSVMPAMLWPVPGGLRIEQVTPIIQALGAEGLVGMDIVEIAPPVDLPNGITSLTAGRLVLDGVAAARGFRG